MIFKNPKLQKIISFLLIVSVLAPAVLISSPRKAEATGVPVLDILGNIWDGIKSAFLSIGSAAQTTDTAISVKNVAQEIFRQVLMAIARKALQEITKSTINWINGGFHGSPLFLENPQSFFNDIAKSEVKNIVDTFGYDRLKFPFGKDFALNTIATYKNTLENNTSYTLSNVIKDTTVLHNYQNDFNFGGWNGFLINTQYPQNNYLGFQMTATEELARRVQGTAQSAAQKVQSTLQQGMGFLSPQTCPSNDAYNNGVNEFQKPQFNMAAYDKKNPFNPPPGGTQAQNEAYTNEYNDRLRKAKEDWAKENTCPKGLVSTTPGSVVSNQITTAMGSQFRQSELGAAMGNSLSAIFDALLNKFLGDGLNSLASKKNATPVDNWTYDGQTLGSPNDSDWASGPDQEIILRDFKILIEGKTFVTFKKGQQLFDEDGKLMVYDAGTPILCKDGDRIVDADGNTIEQCTRGEAIYCKEEEKIISKDNRVYNCVNTEDGIQRHSSDPANLDPVLAEGGEVVTLVGDKSIKKDPNTNQPVIDPITGKPIPIPGREYFPGGLENTVQELALMDNPCEPSDEECINNPLKATIDPTDNSIVYKYRPGVAQFIGPVIQSTKTLDQCIPGPDKGWQNRLKEEADSISKEFELSSAEGDKLKRKAASSAAKDLRFAAVGFKDWIETEMIRNIKGSTIFVDAVNEIDNFTQQIGELTNSKRDKFKALGRLDAIKEGLKEITEQPEPGSAEEKTLITLKKQYDAVRSSVSSGTSLENTRNQLNLLKGQYEKLTSEDSIKPGLIKRCLAERAEKWEDIDIQGYGSAVSKNSRNTELEDFCSIPIVSGYSHGTVVRNDTAARKTNCPDGRPQSISCNNEGGSENAPNNWFTFRNPNALPRLVINNNDNNGYGINDYDRYGSDLVNRKYRELPMVNANNVFGDKKAESTGGEHSVNLDCKLIFKAREADYTSAGDANVN